MDIRLSFLILWPDRKSIQKPMPFCFQRNYGLRVTSIIDCFELFIEKPSDLLPNPVHGRNINTIILLNI